MKIKKSSGPKMLPCGTPTVTGFGFDVILFTDVIVVRNDNLKPFDDRI